MRTIMILAAAGAAALTLGSCATMSEEECLAGDWSGRGYADGAEGLTMSRLGEHAEACMKHGVAPDDAAYRAGWAEGVVSFCTPMRGFLEGRNGNSYAGVCPAELEREFVPAYEDGRIVYVADEAVREAESRVSSLGDRLEELDDKIVAKEGELRDEGLSDDQRDAIRNRIREIRREREDTQRDWRRAQSEVDDAERRARDVRYRFTDIYGAF